MKKFNEEDFPEVGMGYLIPDKWYITDEGLGRFIDISYEGDTAVFDMIENDYGTYKYDGPFYGPVEGVKVPIPEPCTKCEYHEYNKNFEDKPYYEGQCSNRQEVGIKNCPGFEHKWRKNLSLEITYRWDEIESPLPVEYEVYMEDGHTGKKEKIICDDFKEALQCLINRMR